MNEKLFIAKGVGLPGREYECRVSLLYFWICVFESICIQFPHDIQLHMEFCCMRKNSSNKLYTGTGAWVITEQTTNKETKKKGYRSNKKIGKNTKYCDIEIATEKVLEQICWKAIVKLKNVVSDDTFTKSDRENAGKKMATVWKS